MTFPHCEHCQPDCAGSGHGSNCWFCLVRLNLTHGTGDPADVRILLAPPCSAPDTCGFHRRLM